MDQKTKQQQVIEVLKSKGYTDEQIAQVVTEVAKSGFANLYSQAMAVLTDEDKAKIDVCKTEEETNQTIRQLFQLRTGKNPDEEMQKFLDNFAEGFLKEHEKEKAAAASNP